MLVSLGVQSQSENVVHAKAIATLINDSSYALKISLQIDKGWHVYGENPDGINAPFLKANLESAKLLQAPNYSIAPITQRSKAVPMRKTGPPWLHLIIQSILNCRAETL